MTIRVPHYDPFFLSAPAKLRASARPPMNRIDKIALKLIKSKDPEKDHPQEFEELSSYNVERLKYLPSVNSSLLRQQLEAYKVARKDTPITSSRNPRSTTPDLTPSAEEKKASPKKTSTKKTPIKKASPKKSST